DLDAVVVDVGPGLYTGIRVGLATAQGLAAAFGIPIVPATSVDALALEARTGHRMIWAVVDVRRGEFAVARYRPVPGGVVKDGPTELFDVEALRAVLVSTSEESLVVGDVAALPDGFFTGMRMVKTGKPRYPYAVTLAEIGHARVEKGAYPAPADIRPLYTREPVVAINWAKIREEGPWASTWSRSARSPSPTWPPPPQWRRSTSPPPGRRVSSATSSRPRAASIWRRTKAGWSVMPGP